MRISRRETLAREGLKERHPRANRMPHPDRNYLAFAHKGIACTAPYSQASPSAQPTPLLGSPWVGPIKAALKCLKLPTITPGATSTLFCPPLPPLSSPDDAGFRTPFPLTPPRRPETCNPPRMLCRAKPQGLVRPSSSPAGCETPRRSSATQPFHYFFFPLANVIPRFSNLLT